MQELANDISGIGGALSGLLLVFLGGVVAAYESYSTTEQDTVRSRFQKRGWFAFAAFAMALTATFLSFAYNYWPCDQIVHVAAIMLVLSFAAVFIAALIEVLGIK